MDTIFIVIGLFFLVLNIIVLVRFFQIAKDTAEIKEQNKELLDILRVRFASTETCQITTQEAVIISDIPNYIEQDGVVTFEDGITGEIGCVFGSFGYRDNEGAPVYFTTKEECIKEMYKYKARSSK